MKNFLCFVTSLGLFLLLSGCAHYHYVPNNMVIPAVEKQHDAVISYAFSGSVGREIQAVYSPLKYVALTYNDMKISPHVRFIGRLQEGGIGAYYGKFPWTVSLIGGYGQGFAENHFRYDAVGGDQFVQSRLDFQQWFIQPGYVFQTRNLRCGMAFRQVWLHYYKGSTDLDNMPVKELATIRSIEGETPFSFTEFGMTLGFRIRPFTFSYNSVSIFGKQHYYESLRMAFNNSNFMITLDLFELWRWKDTPPRKRKNREQITQPETH